MPHKDPEARRLYEISRRPTRAAQKRAARAADPEKARALARARRAKNPEKFREQDRARAPKRLEKKNAYMKARYWEKRLELLAKHAQWYTENRDHVATQSHTRYVLLREQILEQVRLYRLANPDAVRANNQRCRARKKNAPVNDLTSAQWLEIQIASDHRCVYCGKRRKGHLTQDHLTALSQGGSHTASNVLPACSTCNSRKYTGPPLVPVQPLLLTLAPSRKPRRAS